MPADRPYILTARVEQNARVQMCKNHLEAMDKGNRPNSATVDDVRGATENALQAVTEAGGSVADVEGVKCPCVRLGADTCLSHP